MTNPFIKPLNQRTVTLKIKRIELANLMIATTTVYNSTKEAGESGEKWKELHDKLKAALDEFDAKQEI